MAYAKDDEAAIDAADERGRTQLALTQKSCPPEVLERAVMEVQEDAIPELLQ